MELNIPKTVKILIKHVDLVEKWDVISDALEIPKEEVFKEDQQWKKGTLLPYTLFTHILTNWTSRKGSAATVEKLRDILDSENFDKAVESLQTAYSISPKEKPKDEKRPTAAAEINTPPERFHFEKSPSGPEANRTGTTVTDAVAKDRRRSEVKSDIEIDIDNWAVSIVRMKKSFFTIDMHVFLILEAIFPDNHLETYFMDFVVTRNSGKPGLVQGKIRYHPVIGDPGRLYDSLLYSVKLPNLMRIKKGTKLIGFTWKIPKDLGVELRDAVNDKKGTEHAPQYNILGRDAVVNSLPSSEIGDNCFTWARDQLHALGDTDITGLKGLPDIDDWKTWLFALPPFILRMELNQPNAILHNVKDWIITNKIAFTFMVLSILYIMYLKSI